MTMAIILVFLSYVGVVVDIAGVIGAAAFDNNMALVAIPMAIYGAAIWTLLYLTLKKVEVSQRDTMTIVSAYIACALQVGMISFCLTEQFTLFIVGAVGLFMMSSIVGSCRVEGQDDEDVYEEILRD